MHIEGLTHPHYNKNEPKDIFGRPPRPFALFLRAGLTRVRLNHIGFEFDDSDEAIQAIESRGVKVDLAGDAMIHGPKDVWYQIASRTTPFPVGHPANDPGVHYADPER